MDAYSLVLAVSKPVAIAIIANTFVDPAERARAIGVSKR